LTELVLGEWALALAGDEALAEAAMVTDSGDSSLPKTNLPLWKTKKKCLRKN